eukprot:197748_1
MQTIMATQKVSIDDQSFGVNQENKITSLDDTEIEQKIPTNNSEIIKLNIGGMKFETCKATLLKSKYFKALLSNKFGDQKVDGYYFVDRNGEYFEYLLDYLRCGYVSVPTKLIHILHFEAQFFQIEIDLKQQIKEMQSPHLILKALVEKKPHWRIKISINGQDVNTIKKDKYKLNAMNIPHTIDDIAAHLEKHFGYEIWQRGSHPLWYELGSTRAIRGDTGVVWIHLKPKIPEFVMIMLSN